jgi:hypothetical protein
MGEGFGLRITLQEIIIIVVVVLVVAVIVVLRLFLAFHYIVIDSPERSSIK